MKANEAPEKIYLEWYCFGDKKYREWVLIPKTNNEPVEYTRTDAFIEKVARFLEYKLNDRVEIQIEGTLIPSLTSKKAFIEDFRNFMKG